MDQNGKRVLSPHCLARSFKQANIFSQKSIIKRDFLINIFQSAISKKVDQIYFLALCLIMRCLLKFQTKFQPLIQKSNSKFKNISSKIGFKCSFNRINSRISNVTNRTIFCHSNLIKSLFYRSNIRQQLVMKSLHFHTRSSVEAEEQSVHNRLDKNT